MESATPLQPLELAHELDGLADRHQNRARMFLVIALGVIGLGIGAVMFLPPVIAWVDALFKEVEPDAVVETLQTNINARTETLQGILNKQQALVAALNVADKTLGEVWQRQEIAGADGNPQQGEIRGIIAVGGSLFAFGGDSLGGNVKVLLLKGAVDGTGWQRQEIAGANGNPQQGFINGIATVSGGLLAYGRDNRKVLLLEGAADGNGWQRQEIAGANGNPQQGSIHGITAVVGGLLVYGSESARFNRKVLLLKGAADGNGWQRQEIAGANGNPQQGFINGIASVSGGLLAYGGDSYSDDGKVLLLEGAADGTGWLWQKIAGVDGNPQQGWINGIAAVGGGLLAYGGASYRHDRKVLLLKGATDGTGWLWQNIAGVDGNPQQGDIYGITAVDNGLLAYGSDSLRGDRKVLLLKSAPDGTGWQRQEIAGVDGNPQQGWINGISAVDDGLLAYGGDSYSDDGKVLLLKAATGSVGMLGHQSALTPPPDAPDDDEDSTAAQASFAASKALLEEPALLLPASIRQLHDPDAPKNWDTNWTERANLRLNYKELVEARADADDWQRLSRISTRVAVLALLIYLVQLCINLYRYNVKLGGFYRGRAQTLRFIAAQPGGQGYTVADLTALFAGLSPDQVGFDRQPTSPMQQIVDIAKTTPRGR